MNFYVRLIAALAITAGVAAGLLAGTYNTTKPLIDQREVEDQAKALQNVFFLQTEGGQFSLRSEKITPDGVVQALYAQGQDKPAYYAVQGKAIGFNSSVPISMIVGFTGPAGAPADLLKGYVEDAKLPTAKDGAYIVGFSIVNSEETPGLGEKAKDKRAPYTWAQALSGSKPAPNPDSSTDFQRQFRGRLASNITLKKNGGDLDAITASTITSNGVVSAIRDASQKLELALASK